MEVKVQQVRMLFSDLGVLLGETITVYGKFAVLQYKEILHLKILL